MTSKIRPDLQSLWPREIPEEKKGNESEESCSASSVKTVQKITNWMVENRGGLALFAGLMIVPSQFTEPNAEKAGKIIKQAAKSNEFRIEQFDLPIDSETSLKGLIYYPKNWSQNDRSQCVLYHNPNGITVAGYFSGGDLSWTPGEIVKIAKRPIVMYDYRGTGLSSNNQSSSSIQFHPTYESVVVDGSAALQYALSQFRSVEVVGSSLGGGVATISLERHLAKNPKDIKKISRLINHDSFSTTPRVVFPGWPNVADWTGWAVGGFLDAATPMKKLIERGISVAVLCHLKDPVIPQGARMAEYIATLPKSRKVSVIKSSAYGHAILSRDMIRNL